ncbi:MAG: hypothetical protein ACI88H_000372 [Cocleimonas sp.]|jgi:hypothetical protein
MPPGPNPLYKPLIGILWIGYLALLILAVFKNQLNLSQGLVQVCIVALFYLGSSTGLYQYILPNDFHITNSNLIIKLKGAFFRFCSSFLYLLMLLPFFFISTNNRYDKALFFAACAISSLLCVISLYKRIRLIEDTSPTLLSSAAQGYAELEGKVRLYDNEIARGPNIELPIMVWYAKNMFSSTAGFILEDEKGRCTIDPRDAEVITPNYRYNDHSYKAIYPGETIYVLGYLETLNKHRTEYERNSLIGKKVLKWKQNRFHFLDLFDRNNDGKIDDSEMQNVRESATNLVDAELEEVYQEPATHVVSHPNDGRPFLLSSIHPDQLLKKYKISLWVHTFIWIYLSIIVLAMQVG